jgi:hypothetical protein
MISSSSIPKVVRREILNILFPYPGVKREQLHNFSLKKNNITVADWIIVLYHCNWYQRLPARFRVVAQYCTFVGPHWPVHYHDDSASSEGSGESHAA